MIARLALFDKFWNVTPWTPESLNENNRPLAFFKHALIAHINTTSVGVVNNVEYVWIDTHGIT